MKKKPEMPLMDFFNEFLKDDEIKLQPHQKEVIKAISEGKKMIISQPRKFGNKSLIDLMNHKYRPIGKYAVFMLVIKNPEGVEVSHWSCEEPDVDDFSESSKNRGMSVQVYPIQEYYERVSNNEFQLVKRSEPLWQKR